MKSKGIKEKPAHVNLLFSIVITLENSYVESVGCLILVGQFSGRSKGVGGSLVRMVSVVNNTNLSTDRISNNPQRTAMN